MRIIKDTTINLFYVALLLIVFFLNGCAVWTAREKTYSMSIESSASQDDLTQEISTFIEGHFEDADMVLVEKYQELYPGHWWILKFKIKQSDEKTATCERPSICIHPVSEKEIQISYRILCLESFFSSRPIDGEPKDMILDMKDDLTELLSNKTGKNISLSLMREKRALSGECGVW